MRGLDFEYMWGLLLGVAGLCPADAFSWRFIGMVCRIVLGLCASR